MSSNLDINELINLIIDAGYGDLLNWQEIRKQRFNIRTDTVYVDNNSQRENNRVLDTERKIDSSFIKPQNLRRVPYR